MSLTPGLTGLLEAVQSLSTIELAFLLLFLAGALWLLKLILTMRVWLFILILFPIVWFLSSAGQSNCLLSSRSWVRILQEPPNASVMEQVDIADLKSVGLRPCEFESRRRYQIQKDINSNMEKEIHLGDILVMLPFAYILSQSLLMMDFVWFFGALWIFDIYAKKRRKQDV